MADLRLIKTTAEQQLADEWQRVKGGLPGPAELREQAFRRFAAEGLPHRRVEEWKYTDLRTLMREAKPLAAAPDAATRARGKEAGAILGDLDARRIVFVDGAFVPELSDLAALEPGLSIRSLGEALASGDSAVSAHLGKVVPVPDNPAVALNTAFMGDGAVIRIAAGAAVERPLHLVFLNAGAGGHAVFTRSLMVVENGARAMVVESHEGERGREDQVNSAFELVIGDRAHVDHVRIVAEGDGSLLLASLMASVGAGARFNDFTFVTGGAVVRNQLFVRFDGEGTIAGIRGASLLQGRQHADTTMVIDHAVRGCTSREMFKSVLDGESRGVFQGKIIVRPDAQKTDGKMMAQALLLSEAAEADAKPELEIFADDVVCGHGATAGALDEDLLFYLKARGIPQQEAEALLVQAFVGEAVEGIEHAGLREALMEAVAGWVRTRI